MVDGDSFYEQFCTVATGTGTGTGDAPNATAPATTSSALPSATPGQTPVNGYPDPVVSSSDGIVSGYYLTSEENSDVAVLSMLGFDPDSPAEFQAVVQTLIADAKAAGKTKMIIDVGTSPLLSQYLLSRNASSLLTRIYL